MKKANFFNQHLIETNENYFEHFLFAFTTGMWIFITGLILITHAIFPFIFLSTTSKNIKKINLVMQKRWELLLERQNKKAMEE